MITLSIKIKSVEEKSKIDPCSSMHPSFASFNYFPLGHSHIPVSPFNTESTNTQPQVPSYFNSNYPKHSHIPSLLGTKFVISHLQPSPSTTLPSLHVHSVPS